MRQLEPLFCPTASSTSLRGLLIGFACLGVACQLEPSPEASAPALPSSLQSASRPSSPPPVDAPGFRPVADVSYDFEAPAAGVMGWSRAWGEGFDESVKLPVRYSTALATPGNTGAIEIDVDYRGDGREAVLDIPAPADLASFEAVQCEVLLDASLPRHDTTPWDEAFNIGFALNDDWHELGYISPFSFDDLPVETLNGRPYFRLKKYLRFDPAWEPLDASKRFVIRLAGKGFLYRGPLYLDNVVFVRAQDPVILPVTPGALDEVSGDRRLEFRVLRARTEAITRAEVRTPLGRVLPLTTEDGEHFHTLWQTLPEPEGLARLLVRLTLESGTTVEQPLELRVHNGGWTVEISTPGSDQQVEGKVPVVARIGGIGGTAQAVTARLGDVEVALERDPTHGDYRGTLDVSALPEGPQTLVVRAKKGQAFQESSLELMVNSGEMLERVQRRGAAFVVGDQPFRYVGWNSFILPFLRDRLLKTNEAVVVHLPDGSELTRVLPRGSTLSFHEQVDREMLEARRVGLQAMRTWGYRTDGLDSGDWFSRVNPSRTSLEFNEAQFQKFDYIMDSARRHGVRVVIVLQNYWTDFGGIKVTMDQLGSSSRNRFFVDPTAKQLFKDYIRHFVERRNTVNGQLYREDPAIFSWELMNEPRMDGTYEREFWDRDGRMLGAWMQELGAYVRSLDPNHLIASGAEGHPFQGWGLPNEGFGTDPFPVMDQPAIDYFTIHLYPNRQQFRMSQAFAQDLLRDFVTAGLDRGKPVVLEEWGFEKLYPVRDAQGVEVGPEDPRYAETRLQWHRLLLDTFHQAGGSGSHLWGFQKSAQDKAFAINVYAPPSWAKRDRPFVEHLEEQAKLLKMPAAANTR